MDSVKFRIKVIVKHNCNPLFMRRFIEKYVRFLNLFSDNFDGGIRIKRRTMAHLIKLFFKNVKKHIKIQKILRKLLC